MKNWTNKIDIIFPNYNKAEFVGECLHSLKNQTFQNWRCIVVDGFSDDGSWEIIQELARYDQRFHLYQVPRNGLYKSWNFGLSKVQNPYFCILTSDDLWNLEWLEIAVDSLNMQNNVVCAAAKTRIVSADGQWQDIAPYNKIGDTFFQTNNEISQLRKGIINTIGNYFLGPIYSSIHSLVMRSELLKNIGMFSEDLGAISDYEWSLKIGFYGDVVYHPHVEVGWRFYQGQVTHPSAQEENGKLMQEIHRRHRNTIAERLGLFSDKFLAIAEDYDRSVLAYTYSRPWLTNLFHNPRVEVPRFLRTVYSMPDQFFTDIFFKITGKSLFVEKSLFYAIKVAKVINNYPL